MTGGYQMVGRTFSRLRVLKYAYNKWRKKHWEVECDCGNITYVQTQKLISGHTRSCGCLSREVARKNRLAETKHGHMKNGRASRTYSSWRAMRGRCMNINHNDYHRYGAVGITVCDEWSSFETFLKDMGERPKNTTIDRIDNSKGYYPGNCRWSTPVEQIHNSSSTKLNHNDIKNIRGDSRSQSIVAAAYGISQTNVSLIKTRKTWNDHVTLRKISMLEYNDLLRECAIEINLGDYYG